MMERAYSLLEVKGVRDGPDEWVIEGTASTPTPDRMGDVVEPLGAQFRVPMPLLMDHRGDKPIGRVEFARPTASGIPFRAHLPKVAEPGALKDRVDEAVQSIRYRLRSAVSIGFRALSDGVERMKDGGLRFKSWEWLELSLVTIPANSEATISAIKSLDSAALAASGHRRGGSATPGASGKGGLAAATTTHRSPRGEGNTMQTIQEFTELRAQKSARAVELRDAAKAADRELTDAEADEFDGLTDEIKDIDSKIRFMRFDQTNAAAARQVSGLSAADAARSRQPQANNTSRSNLPKGTAVTRFVIAMANGRGSLSDALKFAERWDRETPEVSRYIKAVAGTAVGGSDTWGSQLAEPILQEFVELLMPETIIGKINGFRRVPFNVQVRVQTGGGLVEWVGEAKAKPVGEQSFELFRLGINKVAGIIVLSEELVRLSTPSAEENVRQDMVKQVAKFLDVQFLDPDVSASADNPASVLNTSTPIPATGTDAQAFRADMRALRAAFRAANLSTAGSAIIMNGGIADALADMNNALGQPEFPTISSTGGTYRGSQVVVSESVPVDSTGSLIAMVKPSEILMADDGVTRIDASREATLDMGDSDGTSFNLWQKNCVGIRAERWITWLKAREEAAQYISGAAYDPDAGS